MLGSMTNFIPGRDASSTASKLILDIEAVSRFASREGGEVIDNNGIDALIPCDFSHSMK